MDKKVKILIKPDHLLFLRESLDEIADIDHGVVRAYSFDWDDNIINMPTMIRMEKLVDGEWVPEDISTEEFVNVRGDEKYRLGEDAFINFRVEQPFLDDLEQALNSKSFAPSFEKFKEALIFANPISIITARGHKPETLRKGMDVVIKHTFSDEEMVDMVNNIRERLPETMDSNDEDTLKKYLDGHEYHPVSSLSFSERFGTEHGSASSPEENKKVAFRDYVERVIKNTKSIVDGKHTKLSVGFSDDDLGNVKAMLDFINDELKHEFPETSFVVYDTSEGGNKKIVIKRG